MRVAWCSNIVDSDIIGIIVVVVAELYSNNGNISGVTVMDLAERGKGKMEAAVVVKGYRNMGRYKMMETEVRCGDNVILIGGSATMVKLGTVSLNQ